MRLSKRGIPIKDTYFLRFDKCYICGAGTDKKKLALIVTHNDDPESPRMATSDKICHSCLESSSSFSTCKECGDDIAYYNKDIQDGYCREHFKQLIPFNEDYIKSKVNKFGKDGSIKNVTLSNTKEGYIKLELEASYPNGNREYLIFTRKSEKLDDFRKIDLKAYDNLEERNDEINRLYKEKGVTQEFIAKIFGLKQPSISGILKKYK